MNSVFERIDADAKHDCQVRCAAVSLKFRPICHLVGLSLANRNAVVETIALRKCEVATHESVEALLWNGDKRRPGCVIAPLQEEGEFAGDLPQRLADYPSRLKVVFLVESIQTGAVVEAFRQGAGDVVLWPSEAVRIKPAIERAFASALQEQNLVERYRTAREKLSRITTDEFEVVVLILAGIANKNVASRLGIAESTVEIRRKTIFEKLETRNCVEIYLLVQDAGHLQGKKRCQGASAQAGER